MMNKKLIAAAVSAAVVAPVAAYGEATFYGRINNAIDQNDVSDKADAESTVDLSGVSSRFGFKYNQEVGNGMSVHGQYEFSTTTDRESKRSFVRSDDATKSDTTGVDDIRIATVGLSSSFGRVDLGNQWSSYYNTFGTLVSPTYTLGYYLYTGVGGGVYRASNTIKYSNNFGPLYAELDVRLNESDESADVAETLRGDGIGLGLSWAVTDNITIAAAFDSEDGAGRDKIDAVASSARVGTPAVAYAPATTATTARVAADAYTLLDPIDYGVLREVAAVTVRAVDAEIAEVPAAQASDDYRPETKAVSARPADDAPDTDRIGLGVKVNLGDYWVNLGWQNYEVDDDERTGANNDVDIDTAFIYGGGKIGEKTTWLIGYSQADDGRSAVAPSQTVLSAADATRINAATPAGIPNVVAGDRLDDAVEGSPATDDSTQLTWGIYHNLGGGMSLYYEATSVESENNQQDGARHLLGMRVNF